tara:strand:- start:3426 stop:3926 length:501 start_codon:yes stop_codon:yes gene_type:complete
MSSKHALPPLPLTGGCQCGRIRYRLTARPLVFYLCHCTECQRHTSSAFGESLRFDRTALEVTGGLSVFRRLSDRGSVREGWFCPDCGVRIWHGTEGSAQINIKAGTLDDTSWLVPAGHIWMRSRQPFFRHAAEDLVYETQPEDNYAALIARWREMFDAPSAPGDSQ